MNFQNLSRIENADFYVDLAVRDALKGAASLRSSPRMRGKRKDISASMEEKKVILFIKTLSANLENIEKGFPSIDNLPVFYQELIDITIDKEKLKKTINTISWIKKKSNDLAQNTLRRIKTAKSIPEMNNARRALFGRVKSLLERRKKEFVFLEESRKKIKNFPSIKEGFKTACICGYPNVGKSTLLSKLTTARPEINIYPFTTKGLMLGYIGKDAQIIDAPGTFGNEFFKMNTIEKQSYLALKHLAEVIVFVMDLSESCGYEVQLQEDLLKNIKDKFKHKKFLIYLSKTDMIEPEKVKEFSNSYQKDQIFIDINELKKVILAE